MTHLNQCPKSLCTFEITTGVVKFKYYKSMLIYISKNIIILEIISNRNDTYVLCSPEFTSRELLAATCRIATSRG